MKKKDKTKEIVTPKIVTPKAVPVVKDRSTDALYAFITWLSVSPNRVYRIGGSEESRRVTAALSRFCTENNLPSLSEDWENKFKYPTHFI
jgi:hypothetical protein